MANNLERRRNFLAQLSVPKVWAVAAASAVGAVAFFSAPRSVTFGDFTIFAGPVIVQIGNQDQVATDNTKPIISFMSREVGSEAGGEWMYLTGDSLGVGLTVTVGGITATVDSINSAGATDTVFITLPNYSGSMPAQAFDTVDIIATNTGAKADTLTGFEYAQAPATTYVSHSFDDNTDGGFTASGSCSGKIQTFPTSPVVTGARSAFFECVAVSGGSGGGINGLGWTATSPTQPPLNTYGYWQRWYVRVDATTISNFPVSFAGLKLLLNRKGDGSNPPSWFHVGVGSAFQGCSGDSGVLSILSDHDTGCLSGGQSNTGHTFVADEWVEVETWYRRAGSTGRARMWINGKLTTDETDASFGTDTSGDDIAYTIGIVYLENDGSPADTFRVWVDDAAAADGYIARVD